MNVRDFKNWLKGYLAGCGASSEEELSKEQLMKVIQMMELVVEEPRYYYYPSWGTYTVTSRPSTWLSDTTDYVEKKFGDVSSMTDETRERLIKKVQNILNR